MAPRLAGRPWHWIARGALLACLLWPGLAGAQDVTSARYDGATSLYGHLVLGKGHNWSDLIVTLADGQILKVSLKDRVFEDTAPRLVDMDGDGLQEVLAVEAKPGQGARMAFYAIEDGALSLRAATPYIGTNNRWLAPVGVADFDGDGAMEFAYVDRPHLAKTLRLWRWNTGDVHPLLEELTMLGGVSNHRIGEDWISGGVRVCGEGPEMLVARGDWREMLAVRVMAGEAGVRLAVTPLGPDTSRAAFDQALACE